MSEALRDWLVLAATAAALVVAIVVTAHDMFPPVEKAKAVRSEQKLLLPYFLTPEGVRAPLVEDVQLPTLPSVTSKEAHGG